MDVQILAESDTDVPLISPLVLVAVLFLVALLLSGVSAMRASNKETAVGKAFADTHGQRAGALIAETDRLIRGLQSPLLPPNAWADWEVAKQEYAQNPWSTEAIEKIYAASENVRYLTRIEGGDERCRHQAINELMTEARTRNAQPVFRDIAALRGREVVPTFVEEYVRVVHSVGRFSTPFIDDKVPVSITNWEFRPAAGVGGFEPAGAVWNRSGKYGAKSLVDPDDLLLSCSEAQVYRRFRRGMM